MQGGGGGVEFTGQHYKAKGVQIPTKQCVKSGKRKYMSRGGVRAGAARLLCAMENNPFCIAPSRSDRQAYNSQPPTLISPQLRASECECSSLHLA